MQEDDELVLLKYTVTQGWPSIIKEVSQIYYNLTEHSEKNLQRKMVWAWKALEL